MVFRHFLFLIGLLVGEIIYAGQEVGNISGTVVDRTTKQPLPGVNVCILGTTMGAATDTNGKYLIEKVPMREYSIEASMIGYKPVVQTRIYPVPNRTITLNFKLSQTPIELKGVTVTPEYFSKEKDAVTSSHEASSYEIRMNPEGYSVQRILASLPGIGTVEDWSAQLIVRGGAPDENLCLVDNVEIGSPTHFGWFGGEGGNISIINTWLVRDICFSTGGFPAKYGDKLSSFMDISLREGNKNKFEANFDFNMSRAGVDFSGPISNKGSYLFSYGRSYLELLDKVSDIGNVLPKYDEFQGKIAYNISPINKLSLMGIKTIDNMRVPKSEMGSGAKSDMLWNGGENIIGFNWQSLFSKSGYSLFTLSGTSHKLDFGCEGSFGVNSTLSTLAAKESITYRFSPAVEFEAGGEYKYINLDWGSFSVAETTSTGIPFPGDTTDTSGTSYKVGSYTQFSFSFIPRLLIKPGVRYDYFESNDENIVSPRVGLSYALSNIASLNLSYGEFYQFPQCDQLLSNLSSKHATHYVIGIEHLLTPSTKVSVEGYRKNLNNLIVRVSDSTRELDNSGEGYAQGIEFLLQKKLKEKFWGSMSYSYSVSKRKDRWGEQDYADGWYYSDWDQPNIFTIIGGYKLSDKLDFSIKWRYASGKSYTPLVDKKQDPITGTWYRVDGDMNSARYPSYHRLDFQIAQYHTFRGWGIITYFNLQNIYNRKNILAYTWNDDYTERKGIYQFLFMPVGGITIEF
ncbi:TonB-dependent receptor [candidate division WOR-3 bacterium]|nr:TonB-dependent receptor [candidate division WOR-3 bacterium]